MAGLLIALSVPPVGLWPLGIAGVGLLGHLLAGRSWPRRIAIGGTAGLVLYGVTLAWMAQFNAIGAVLVMLLEAGFLLLAAVATAPGRWRAAGWPAALVVAEQLRTVVPFGGLPMGGIDLGQAAGPLAPAARLGGPLLVVAATAAAGLALESIVDAAARHRLAGLGPRLAVAAVAAAFVAVVAAGGAASPDARVTGTLRVAAVQGGGRRGLRAVENPPILVFDAQLAADRSVRPPVDLVVWPENVIALDGPLAGSTAEATVGDDARALGATLVAGVTEPVGRDRFRNAAVAWSPDGALVARYDKAHRVPFGEYIPGRSFIRHLVNLDVVPRDAIPGHGPGLLRTPAGRLGVLISFEVYFSSRARAAVRAGAEVVLVPTNTASYTTAQVPDSEMATARLRAWETGRDVVMAAPTGFSAVIDPRGRTRLRSGLGGPAVLEATVARRSGETPYTRLGNGPFVVAALALVGLSWAGGALDRTRATSKP